MDVRKWDFTEDHQEFVIKDQAIPREWINVHYSGAGERITYWSRCTNTGRGPVFFVDERGNRCQLTPGHGHKYIYLRDEDDFAVWNAAGSPVATPVEGYECRYRLEATVIASSFRGIAVSQRCFVPHGQAYEIWTVSLENKSGRARSISLFPYASVQLDGFKTDYPWGSWHKRAEFREEINGLYAWNVFPNSAPQTYTAVLLSSHPVTGTQVGDQIIFPPPHGLTNPGFSRGGDLIKTNGSHDKDGFSLLLQNKLKLEPGETVTVHYAFGHGGGIEGAKQKQAVLQSDQRVEALLAEVRERELRMSRAAEIRTGDERIDGLFNVWMKKQMHTYLAFKTGVRDNLQTDDAFVTVDYHLARNNVLTVLAHQYEDGHFPHSFRPLNEHHYGDKTTWIFTVLPGIIKEEGEFFLLEERIPYIRPGGARTDYQESVLQHLVRALNHLRQELGPHGCLNAHRADWNDDLSGPGADGGESVMATMTWCAGLRSCAELLDRAGHPKQAGDFRELYDALKQSLNQNCWDGGWYQRAYTGSGNVIGSHQNNEGKIYLNSQAWAVLAGLPDKERLQTLLHNVDKHLITPYGMKVLDPLYTTYTPDVGYLSAALPGYFVNGIYNHAGAFMLMANCMAGRGDKAWQILEAILPDSINNPSEQSLCEPFALTNCYRCDDLCPGVAGDVWHTGTTPWVYMGILEGILGIQRDYDGLRISPCLPSHLTHVSVTRHFRGCRYDIEILNKNGRNCGVQEISIDGAGATGSLIRHIPGRTECRVLAII